jgi:hypothetical protein
MKMPRKQPQAPRHSYSSEEIEFLKKIVKGRSYKEINTLFNERFGLELSFFQTYLKIRSLGVVGKTSHTYTPDEVKFLKENIAGRCYAELTKLFNEHFGLTLVEKQIYNLCFRYKFENGKKIGPQGLLIGSESISKKGTILVKVRESPKGGKVLKYKERWREKHALIWENVHGPIPEGHAILFADKNKSNLNLDNLLLVSYAERAILNMFGLISSDPELTKASLLVARLKLLVAKRARELKERGVTP